MTVISEGPYFIKIYLTKHEVKKYFNDLESIVFAEKDIKETVILLLDIATCGTSFEKGNNLCLDVYPTSNGGLILNYVFQDEARLSGKNIKIKNKTIIYVFGFKNFEDIIKLSKAFTKNKASTFLNKLYYLNNIYYIIIEIPEFDKVTPVFTNEFSFFSARGKIIKEVLDEYGKCIMQNNALKKIDSLFN
jgi:hypothetical protein